jgi:hypothetical protein
MSTSPMRVLCVAMGRMVRVSYTDVVETRVASGPPATITHVRRDPRRITGVSGWIDTTEVMPAALPVFAAAL